MTTAPSQTVLVVEDEPLVRLSVRYYLERHGYTVLEAASADEACLKAGAEHVDLLLADLVLPGSGLPDLGQRVRQIAPRARQLHMSAYPLEWVIEHHPQVDPARVMEKPFSEAELILRVRDCFTRS